jgi:hypothetical protein
LFFFFAFSAKKIVPYKKPTTALLRRVGFFVGQAATAAQRKLYVMRSGGVHYF